MAKRSRKRGATTFELVISGTIFAAIAVASTAMMTESIRGTTKSTVASRSVDETRLTMDRLQADVRQADMMLSRVRFPNMSGWQPSDRDDVILRIPAVDANGVRIPGRFRIVWWDEDSIGGATGPHHIMRFETTMINGVMSPVPPGRRFLTNVQNLQFRYFRQETVVLPTSRRLPLPGPAVSGTPSGTQVKVVAVRGLNVRVDDEDDEADDLDAVGFGRTGSNVLAPPSLAPGIELDVLYEVAGGQSRNAESGNGANILEVTVLHRRPTNSGPVVTQLNSRVSLRND